jgi:hypothetical protein
VQPERDVRVERAQRGQITCGRVDLDAEVPADHEVRAIAAVVDKLDLRGLAVKDADVHARGEIAGAPATDPKIFLGLWAHATGSGTPPDPPTRYEASFGASPDATRPQGIRTSADLGRTRGRLVTGACKLTRLTPTPRSQSCTPCECPDFRSSLFRIRNGMWLSSSGSDPDPIRSLGHKEASLGTSPDPTRPPDIRNTADLGRTPAGL